MKKLICMAALLAVLVACETKEDNPDNLTEEQIQSYESTAMSHIDQMDFRGKYGGMVQGKDVQLTLQKESYELQADGKKYKGKYYKAGDGSQIELENEAEPMPVTHLAYSDAKNLMVLNADGTYPEDEVFLQKK
ncbi:MAG: hypothetical protein Q4F57_09040 [Weeksellaceae bacterium]|nr:hypothetical protein [Weeksellaceae bacterium]